MKSLIAGLFTAFALYSIIPTPKTEWKGDNMRYALCFFPLIGVVTGGLSLLLYTLCVRFDVAPALYGVLATLLPILVSGGIHMDGFIDTADAISSHALREKKLEILKDSHVGAFGVLYCVAQLLLSYGLWQQLYLRPRCLPLVAAGYALSRCCSALSVATFPTAKSSGLVHLFADSAAKRSVVMCSLIVAAAVLAACIVWSPLWGVVMAAAAALYFLLHRRFCIWEFGGNTGDLAGFLLQNMELLILAVAVVGGLAY